MQNKAWIGLVFLFLQLLLASCSEGENILAVVEQGARVVSIVEDGVDVPGGAKIVGNRGFIWWGAFAGDVVTKGAQALAYPGQRYI